MSFGVAGREQLYKQVNPLGAYVPKDYSDISESGSTLNVSPSDGRFQRAPNAHFGYSSRSDHEKMANFIGSPQAADHSHINDTTDATKIVSKMDSRYQTSPSPSFGVAKRSDVLKRANDLHCYLPKDYSHVSDNVSVKSLTKAIDAQFRNPPRVPFSTAARDDYKIRNNPLGVYIEQDYSLISDNADISKVISPVDSRYRRNPAARFSKSSRDDLKLQANPLGVYQSKDYSHMPDNTDPSKLISRMDSRWKNQPNVPFSTSKRDDILKHANVLGVAQPSKMTSSVKYPDKTISDFDSRFKTQPRVPMSTAPRDAIYKQANPLGSYVAKDYSEFSDSTATDATISKIDSRWKSPPSVHFGHSARSDIELRANDLGVYQARDHSNFDPRPLKLKTDMDSRFKTAARVHFGHSDRSDILKRANDLGTYLPKDYSHQASDKIDINKLVSPMDARYKTPPAFTMGASKREDIIKQANPLGVPMPRLDQTDRPIYCAPSSFEVAAAAARKGGCGHTMGASDRASVLKLYNPQNVPLPKDLSGQDDRTDFSKLVSPMDSRYKRPRTCTFGVGEREDIILLANTLGAKHPPHSRRAAELKARQNEYFGKKSKNTEGTKQRPSTMSSNRSSLRRGKLHRRAASAATAASSSTVFNSKSEDSNTGPAIANDNDDNPEQYHDDETLDHSKTPPISDSNTSRGDSSFNSDWSTKTRKSQKSLRQQLLSEVRRENARHRKGNAKKKLIVMQRARKNSSSWVKYFQRTGVKAI